ncbi:Uncharacterised protein [Mycobacteroides abscessus subsp. abscessus]|nr:Uncharacterised protein [Mycobacteroides abscessus subsp. abscessus]
MYPAVLNRITRRAVSTDSSPEDSDKISRYWPPSTSLRRIDQTPRARTCASGESCAPTTMSSAHVSARSPRRIAADIPNCSGEPDQPFSRCSAANSTWMVGSPRLVAELSMTSSWMSAQVCSSSSAAHTRRTSGFHGFGSSVIARQPQ